VPRTETGEPLVESRVEEGAGECRDRNTSSAEVGGQKLPIAEVRRDTYYAPPRFKGFLDSIEAIDLDEAIHLPVLEAFEAGQIDGVPTEVAVDFTGHPGSTSLVTENVIEVLHRPVAASPFDKRNERGPGAKKFEGDSPWQRAPQTHRHSYALKGDGAGYRMSGVVVQD